MNAHARPRLCFKWHLFSKASVYGLEIRKSGFTLEGLELTVQLGCLTSPLREGIVADRNRKTVHGQ